MMHELGSLGHVGLILADAREVDGDVAKEGEPKAIGDDSHVSDNDGDDDDDEEEEEEADDADNSGSDEDEDEPEDEDEKGAGEEEEEEGEGSALNPGARIYLGMESRK
eukprot:jgi/Tetstr1/423755/TSEL_014386.t1